MPEQTGRFAWTYRIARIWLIAALILLTLALAATAARGVVAALKTPAWTTLSLWALAMIAEAVAAVGVIVAFGLVRVAVANEFAVTAAATRLERIETLMDRQAEATKKLTELASLSDQAKSLIFREREVEAIREAVHGDLMRQDYRTAEQLIDAVEKKFGYVDVAGRLREEVQASRKATMAEKIDAAVGRVQGIVDRRDWARALRESQRLIKLFPDNPKVTSLPERIQTARTERKRQLLQEYSEAVRKNDVDQSIGLLRELDGYLAPKEAAALQESARGVFKARLQQLGVQFAIRVHDEQWSGALDAGDDIIREFPNSRMAQEVREKRELLKARAEEVPA